MTMPRGSSATSVFPLLLLRIKRSLASDAAQTVRSTTVMQNDEHSPFATLTTQRVIAFQHVRIPTNLHSISPCNPPHNRSSVLNDIIQPNGVAPNALNRTSRPSISHILHLTGGAFIERDATEHCHTRTFCIKSEQIFCSATFTECRTIICRWNFVKTVR